MSAGLGNMVRRIAARTPVLDIHTHIYPPRFGELLLWGIDELLCYHYLVAEVFRVAPQPLDRFRAMSLPERADYIWKHLFLEHSPVSEACRGVLTALSLLGLDPATRNLEDYRAYFRERDLEAHLDHVFERANLSAVIMTNDPFDDAERPVWEGGVEPDGRFHAALRMDPLLMDWEAARARLSGWGYAVGPEVDAGTEKEVRRFLEDWIARMKPRYMAVSLTPDFACETESPRGRIIDRCILPVGREHNLPFANMIGVQRRVNPDLDLAGDAVGKASIGTVIDYCANYPHNKFLVTMLSRENQHELCVAARKFPNLLIFGCWWFLNNPSIVEEMTRERIELLGPGFIPQHSDARVLEHLLYKWEHSRQVIGKVLAEKYEDLAATGWRPTEEEIKRDVAGYFGGFFERFLAR